MRDDLKGAPEECLERICDASWGCPDLYKEINGVTFLAIHQHNACNHTLSGTIVHEGQTFGFIIDNGDWAGTEVRAWGDPEDVGVAPEPEPPEPRTFIPRDRGLFLSRPELWSVYLAWRKEPWFRDLERSYNYDRHFQPGGKVEGYYAEKAAKRGLVVGYVSQLGEEERASIEGRPAQVREGVSLSRGATAPEAAGMPEAGPGMPTNTTSKPPGTQP